MIKIDKISVDVSINNVNLERLIYAPEVQKVTSDVADHILDYQKILCPVDSGNMLRHMKKIKDVNGVSWLVGCFGVDYILYVVNGHMTRNHKTRVHANPFIQRSVDILPNTIEG